MNQQNLMGQVQNNAYPAWGRFPVYNFAPIQGEIAAWQFPLGPCSELCLPDMDENIIWWIKTDNNNCRSVQGFDITPHKKPDTEDILSRLDAIEEWINGKSNKPAPKQNSTTNSAVIAK